MKQLLNKIFTALFSIGQDKYMHVTFGALIASVVLCVFCWLPLWASMLISVLLVLSAALIKDLVIDSKPDLVDIVAGVVGGLIVWLPVILLWI